MVFETLVCSPLNHLTRLIARENFIIILLDVVMISAVFSFLICPSYIWRCRIFYNTCNNVYLIIVVVIVIVTVVSVRPFSESVIQTQTEIF
jgi:hypothetical protein